MESEDELDYGDVELVIYTGDADDVGIEPQTNVGKETGVVSISLWIRLENKELPVSTFSEVGDWHSTDVNTHENTEDRRVSDEFVAAVAKTFGFGGDVEDSFKKMDVVERFIFNHVCNAVREMNHSEAHFVVTWCVEEYADE